MGELLACAWFVWLLIGVFAVIVELCTTALVSIWFVPSAAVAAVVSVFCDSVGVQVAVFIALSALFLWLFKKKFASRFSKSEDNEANDMLIGRVAVAQTDINADDGKVLVGDVYWRAVTADDSAVSRGDSVTVTAVSGTTLTVEMKDRQ